MLWWLLHASVSPASEDARSVWSGGVQWGTAVTARANAYWLDDGRVPYGMPFADVAVDSVLLTSSLMSVSWNLGISDFLAELSPNTASASFVGQVSASWGDDFVITTGWGTMWAGRVDTVSVTRDTAGDRWTTVTAIDKVGVLGTAELRASNGVAGTLDAIAVSLADAAGVTITVEDTSDGTYGLASLQRFAYFGDTFDGSPLEYINMAARSSNAWFVLAPDGSYIAQTREALPSAPSSVALTGSNAPVSWTTTSSPDASINRWLFSNPDGTEVGGSSDAADIKVYGEHAYRIDQFLDVDTGSGVALAFEEWWAAGAVHRDVVTNGELVVSDFSQYELLTLSPLDWVTESGDDWQVMSMSWSVAGPRQPMRLVITADGFRDHL